MEVIGFLLLGALVLASLFGATASQKALEDPANTTTVYLEELPKVALLEGTGHFQLIIVRQSGNVHSAYDAPTAAAAMAQAMTTFRRAKIDAIRITLNEPGALHFTRQFYSHRGSSEGKKVGSVEITRLS